VIQLLNNNRITLQVEEYISYKRSLGYVIKIEAQELRRFASYTRSIDYNGSLTTDLAMEWSSLDKSYSRWYMSRRLETIHTFAVYISAFDPNAQIPQNGVFGKCHGRIPPYIYKEKEIVLLMNSSQNLFSPDGIRSKTVATALGLLWATGMRVSELTSLRLCDVHLDERYIFIQDSKFKKDRIITLHPTAVDKLRDYISYVSECIGTRSTNDYFFVTSYGHRFNTRAFEYAFQLIRPCLYANHRPQLREPRLYDIRHTFACQTVKTWLESGEDVNHKLHLLSTYMGHVKPADTYWYLSATPDLLSVSGKMFERSYEEGEGWDEN
jgi:integrase